LSSFGNVRELALCGVQHLVALSSPFLSEQGVTARHKSLARKVGARDLGELLLVEQRELQGTSFDEFSNLWCAQRGDPFDARELFEVLFDAGRGDHASVAYQDNLLEAKPFAQLVELRSKGGRITSVAFEDLDGDRAALGVAEQSENDLGSSSFAIAAVAQLSERTPTPFEVGRGKVVEGQCATGEVLSCEPVFDGLLPGEQPIHRLVEVVFVRVVHLQKLTERAGLGLVLEASRGGKLGARLDDPSDDHGLDEVTLWSVSTADQAVEAQPVQCPEDGDDVSMGSSSNDVESLLERSGDGGSLEDGAQGLDTLRWPAG
jgi:hypothetical protein